MIENAPPETPPVVLTSSSIAELICPWARPIPGSAPRSHVVGPATTARTLYQRLLNRWV
jgi:hypothetical protein